MLLSVVVSELKKMYIHKRILEEGCDILNRLNISYTQTTYIDHILYIQNVDQSNHTKPLLYTRYILLTLSFSLSMTYQSKETKQRLNSADCRYLAVWFASLASQNWSSLSLFPTPSLSVIRSVGRHVFSRHHRLLEGFGWVGVVTRYRDPVPLQVAS